MKRCKGCGNEYRKGKRVLLVGIAGDVATARVCLECCRRAVRIVATVQAPVVRQERTRTDDDVSRVLRMLGVYLSFARQEKLDGRAEGLESAIETIRRELGRPI